MDGSERFDLRGDRAGALQDVESDRLTDRPVMDGSDCDAISDICVASCAAHIHVSIALYRVAAWGFRFKGHA